MLSINLSHKLKKSSCYEISIHQMLSINVVALWLVFSWQRNFNTSNVINQLDIKISLSTVEEFQYIKCYQST